MGVDVQLSAPLVKTIRFLNKTHNSIGRTISEKGFGDVMPPVLIEEICFIRTMLMLKLSGHNIKCEEYNRILLYYVKFYNCKTCIFLKTLSILYLWNIKFNKMFNFQINLIEYFSTCG